MDKWVTLQRHPTTTPDSDGFFENLDPSGVWAHIQPLPAQDDGRVRGHNVTIRYHSQMTVDCVVNYGSRQLFVKGVQDVDEQGAEMRLYCEEVIP
jgi:SPP1 family predicted phage head-tail adaptor